MKRQRTSTFTLTIDYLEESFRLRQINEIQRLVHISKVWNVLLKMIFLHEIQYRIYINF